jgi:hypothetical protein
VCCDRAVIMLPVVVNVPEECAVAMVAQPESANASSTTQRAWKDPVNVLMRRGKARLQLKTERRYRVTSGASDVLSTPDSLTVDVHTIPMNTTTSVRAVT